MQKITPCLWFDGQAGEAVEFYTSTFADGQILETTHYLEAGQEIHGQKPGTVMTARFRIEGHEFMVLNGGPIFKVNPSISFFVSRESKEEIDALWEKLAEGGKALMPLQEYPFSKYYGWIQDRFGVSWQIILPDPDGDWRPALVPSLLFVGEQCGRAEEAIELYTSVFPESQKGVMARYAAGMEPDREGTLMYADFKICDQWFAAMDSAQNHEFGFSEGLSLMVTCRDQAEVDAYWEKLSAVPAAEQCGWLKDKFGVSWQIIPEVLAKLVGGEDSEKANRAMDAMLQMKKIDIAALEAAYNGE